MLHKNEFLFIFIKADAGTAVRENDERDNGKKHKF